MLEDLLDHKDCLMMKMVDLKDSVVVEIYVLCEVMVRKGNRMIHLQLKVKQFESQLLLTVFM